MPRVLICLAVVLSITDTVLAGTVLFDPPVVELTYGDPGNDTVSFDVTIETEFEDYHSLDVLLGSDHLAFDGQAMDWSEEWRIYDNCKWGACPRPLGPVGLYPYDGKFGTFAALTLLPSSLYIGVLTVSAADLPVGEYYIYVGETDPLHRADDRNLVSYIVDGEIIIEPLAGLATVRIVPEPATLGYLVALSLAFAVQRRGTRGRNRRC